MLSRRNFIDIDVITDIGTIGTISYGNFATMQMIMNKDNICFLRNSTNSGVPFVYFFLKGDFTYLLRFS